MLRNPAADALSVSRSHPDQAPRDFEDLESWIQFIREIKNYSADRMRPRDRNGTEPVPSSAKNADSEYSVLAERKERILRLRLSNPMRRTSLEQLRERTVAAAECQATMNRIRVFRQP
jgi:hypothetical protein